MKLEKVGHKLDKVELTINKSKGAVSIFKDWLFENYKLRVNSLDPDDIYLEPTEDNPIKYEYDVTEGDIYLHALEDGLSANKGLINSIIQSPNHSEHFNPITEYLESLKGKYKGNSQIDYLISCLQVTDKKVAKKMAYIIRKWLMATAACVLGKRANDVALGIISDRAGIGKTTFFEELIPLSLRKYTGTVIKNNNNTLPVQYFSNKILLNFDELSAITANTENQFKQLMSSEKVVVPVPGSRRNKQVQRIASVCFTSNKTEEQGGFIKSSDPGMLRRLAVVEVESIKDYREVLDQDMLWAEVVMMLDGGFDYEWNQDDFKYFTNTNKKYIVTTNAMRLVRMYYQVPGDKDKVRYVSSRDLLLEMKKLKRIPSNMSNVDEITLGQALSSAGFKRVIKRFEGIGPRYCYMMKDETNNKSEKNYERDNKRSK